MNVISIIGYSGSGKTVLGKRLAKELNCQHIETSDIVTMLTGENDRSQMHLTNERTADDSEWLGRGIFLALDQELSVLTGVREKEVHDTLRNNGVNLHVICLYCPPQERHARLEARGEVETYIEFKEHESHERQMGLLELFQEKSRAYYVAYDNIDSVVNDIVNELSIHISNKVS